MAMHAALWIGINNDPMRAMDRLGNLLEYTSIQSLNYQYFVRGHHYLNMRQDDPELAEIYLRKAIAHTPMYDEGIFRRLYRAIRKGLCRASIHMYLAQGPNPQAQFNMALIYLASGLCAGR
jgi:hypothetical protein